jgi:probable HAF family extracellular repeat protein
MLSAGGRIGLGLIAAVVAVAWGVRAKADTAEFYSLGTIPGNSNGSVNAPQAMSVSANGLVVVGYSQEEAFRWTQASGMQGLGFLDQTQPASYATGVNDDGSIVVGYGSNSAGSLEAFRWTEADGMNPLGFLSGGDFSTALATDSDGNAVVGVSTSSAGPQAYVWTQAEGMTGLGFLPGGTFSTATGISGDGSIVVGRAMDADGNDEAFRWTSLDGMTALGFLSGGTTSGATGISGDGAVIVGFGDNPDATLEAFRWTQAGGMSGLGFLSGGINSFALGTNEDGTVVVGYGENAALVPDAFRWTAGTGMQSIKGLVESEGVDLSGWSLVTANAVSADGSVIVGYGRNSGGIYEPWLVRLGSGLVTPGDVLASASSLGGSGFAIEQAAASASSALLEVGRNGGCSAQPPEESSPSLCRYGFGSGSILSGSTGDDASGSAGTGAAWREANGFQVGGGPVAAAGGVALAGGSAARFKGYGGGVFAVLDSPKNGLQIALSGATFWLNSELKRAYLNGSTSDSSSGSTDGLASTVEGKIGWRFDSTQGASLVPFADVRTEYVKLNGYTENGGGFPSEINSFNFRRTTLRLGIERDLLMSDTAELTAAAAWGHTLSASSSDISGTVVGLFDFSAPAANPACDFVEMALGAKFLANQTIVSTMIGGTVVGYGDGGSLFGRMTISN